VFAIFFVVLIVGFSTSGYLIYGSELFNYSSYTSSFSSTLRMLLVDYSYEDMRDVNSWLTPIVSRLFQSDV
jgi:hypothetical protein